MTHSNPLLQPLLASPHLPSLALELYNIMLQESEKRSDFYAWLDEDKRAEFIDGEIIVHSPARLIHVFVLKKLERILDDFIDTSGMGGLLLQEQAMVRLERSDLMPDLVYWNADKARALKPDTKLFPVPDFVVEVLSPSTEKHDRGKKMKEYAANRIREYWIADPDKKTIEQYVLHKEEYTLKASACPGEMLEALVLSGLSLDPAAVFSF